MPLAVRFPDHGAPEVPWPWKRQSAAVTSFRQSISLGVLREFASPYTRRSPHPCMPGNESLENGDLFRHFIREDVDMSRFPAE